MSMSRPAVATLLLGILLSAPIALAGDEWEGEFKREFAKPESWNKHAAVGRLDPSIGKARDYLYGVLGKESWYLRSAAIQALQGASGEAIDDLRKELDKNSNPLVREGIALAFGGVPPGQGLASDSARAKDLVEALGDKDERVRRAAAIALARHPVKESIEGVLRAWEKEKQSDVIVFYRETLEKLSGKFLGRSVDDWKAWWEAVKEGWTAPGKKGGGDAGQGQPAGEKSEEDKKAEEKGDKASEEKTVLRDVELNFKEAGKGGPLFVLPEYGYKGIYFEKHLLALSDVARLFYIDLPGASQFKNLPPAAAGMPEYPIDKLCDAFDELRKLRKQERIGILAHGIAGWVAIRYATKFPKNVSHLILVSTWTGGKAWSQGRDRAETFGKQTGDVEFEHFAQSCLLENGTPRYSPKGADDGQALERAAWSGYFHDVRNTYAMLFYPNVDSNPGGVIIPMGFDVAKQKIGLAVPTLLVYGTSPRAIWTSASDMKTFRKYFPNAQELGCPNSNRMPMIEDYDLFVKAVKGFLKKHPFKKK